MKLRSREQPMTNEQRCELEENGFGEILHMRSGMAISSITRYIRERVINFAEKVTGGQFLKLNGRCPLSLGPGTPIERR
jgi:hypothetical protein